MLVKYSIVVLFSLAVTVSTYSFSVKMEFSDYKDILSALLNISSIIFAIIGAWIAIIYPKAIGRVFGGSDKLNEIGEAVKDSTYLSELVEIVLVSALVLMSVLSVQFIYPLARKIQQLSNMVPQLRVAAFFVISLMTFLQLYAIFRVILANYFFLNELRRKNVHDEVDRLHR